MLQKSQKFIILLVSLVILAAPTHIVFAWDFLLPDFHEVAAWAGYYILLKPASWLLVIGGGVFDFFAEHSLASKAYHNNYAITQGWTISRDIANLFFIFILLFIAISTILQIETYGAKRLLVKFIVVALLINFSLLIVQSIIDASNLLAIEFYNAITVKKPNGEKASISEIFISVN